MVYLWTDILIYFLVLAFFVLGWMFVRQAHLRRPLLRLINSPVAVVSLLLLLQFGVIGLLDSIHFKDDREASREVISLLDRLCDPMRKQTEKTYSSPFSAFAYAKENRVMADGSSSWEYPRLQYGASHLQNPESEVLIDIAGISAITFLFALAPLLVLVAGIGYLLKRKGFLNGSFKAGAIELVVTVPLMLVLFELSKHYHVMGTDKVGEDVFYQAIKSIRTGLVIGCLTTIVMLPLAVFFGVTAGFFKGWVDDVIQFTYTTLNSVPSVLLIAASILMVQVYMTNHSEEFNNLLVRADIRLLFLCLILGMTSWTGLCRLLRAETLKLREMEYVLAARSLGVRPLMILYRHILPNVLHIILISVVLDFSSLVLAEAVLSYINIGVDPTTHSWGNMINSARLEMAREPVVWWPLTAAFLMMFGLVLAANLFADKVRDAFDPRRGDYE